MASHASSTSTISRIERYIQAASVDPAADLREAPDIDSMDFLNFITAIHHRLGIDILEINYPKLVSLNGAVTYLRRARNRPKADGLRCRLI
jgi:acyl carrier protein